MTTEELAAQVGLGWDDYWERWEPTKDQLERFAALVRADERERCAELMERQHTWIGSAAASALIRALK